MDKYKLVGISDKFLNLSKFLNDLGYETDVVIDIDDFSDYVVILDEPYHEKKNEVKAKKIYFYRDFINVIMEEFISIGFFDFKTYKILKRTMFSNTSSILENDAKGYFLDDYLLYQHDMQDDYALDYNIITYPDCDNINTVTNTREFNIIYGDRIKHDRNEKNVYYGLKGNNDVIIKNVLYNDFELSFKVSICDTIEYEFSINKRLNCYMREIVGIIIFYHLENLNMKELKKKLSNIIKN